MAETRTALRIEPSDQLAAIGQAVITTDLDGVVLYWNRAAQELYGWTAQEAIGRNIASLTVPEVAQEVAADIMVALRDGVPWSGGFPVRRKDGSRFPALVTDSGIYRDGSLVGNRRLHEPGHGVASAAGAFHGCSADPAVGRGGHLRQSGRAPALRLAG